MILASKETEVDGKFLLISMQIYWGKKVNDRILIMRILLIINDSLAVEMQTTQREKNLKPK